MSQENVEIVKAAVEAWNRGDLDGWLAEADPEVEWHVLPDAPDPGPHRGRQVVFERSASWRGILGDFRAEVLEYIDAGEYVIAPTRMRGRPPDSDVEVVLDEVWVSRFCNGKIVELREYRTKAEALEAVGLSE
jgi:ketosteroid isomerase-like protein